MSTHHTEKHPNELLGADVDSPRPVLHSGSSVTSESTYRKMKCYNLATGAVVGWLGTYGNNVDLVHDAAAAVGVAWSPYGSDMYLRKATSPNDRFLGLGWNVPKLPGLGEVDWSAFCAALTDAGYRGPVCVEGEDRAFEGSLEDRKRSLRQSRRFLSQSSNQASLKSPGSRELTRMRATSVSSSNRCNARSTTHSNA